MKILLKVYNLTDKEMVCVWSHHIKQYYVITRSVIKCNFIKNLKMIRHFVYILFQSSPGVGKSWNDIALHHAKDYQGWKQELIIETPHYYILLFHPI